MKLSHEYLLEILEYFPDTGIFVWKVKQARCIGIGKEAGYRHKPTGRYRIVINNIQYLRSRLAWFYVHGKWPKAPKDQIDHRNMIKDDDRIENLREANSQENQWNAVQRRKDDLPKGIYRHGNKFKVELKHGNKLKYLGLFSNLEDAIKIRNQFDVIHRKFLYE